MLIDLLLHNEYKWLASKIHFPIGVVLNSLQIQKGPGTSFRLQFLYNFFI